MPEALKNLSCHEPSIISGTRLFGTMLRKSLPCGSQNARLSHNGLVLAYTQLLILSTTGVYLAVSELYSIVHRNVILIQPFSIQLVAKLGGARADIIVLTFIPSADAW